MKSVDVEVFQMGPWGPWLVGAAGLGTPQCPTGVRAWSPVPAVASIPLPETSAVATVLSPGPRVPLCPAGGPHKPQNPPKQQL